MTVPPTTYLLGPCPACHRPHAELTDCRCGHAVVFHALDARTKDKPCNHCGCRFPTTEES